MSECCLGKLLLQRSMVLRNSSCTFTASLKKWVLFCIRAAAFGCVDRGVPCLHQPGQALCRGWRRALCQAIERKPKSILGSGRPPQIVGGPRFICTIKNASFVQKGKKCLTCFFPTFRLKSFQEFQVMLNQKNKNQNENEH